VTVADPLETHEHSATVALEEWRTACDAPARYSRRISAARTVETEDEDSLATAGALKVYRVEHSQRRLETRRHHSGD
jgi:hypothetical protein